MKRFLPLALVFVSCNVPSESGDFGDIPDEKSFVDSDTSLFMERRCGSLDCHGQVGRPLRLYSEWGLRLEPTKTGARNGSPTTNAERRENYYSVAGLEPENLSDCYTAGEDCQDPAKTKTFQLLKKPLGMENGGIRHKGGPVLRATPTDTGWACLFGWASGAPDKTACDDAAKVQ
jgi:hypothetical protein